MGFALQYLFALGVVALLLSAMHIAARFFARRRPAAGTNASLRIFGSVQLTKEAALHIAGLEGRRYLVGTAAACIALLAELPGEPRETAD